MKRLAMRLRRNCPSPETVPYCPPLEHTWVQVVGGKGYDEGWDTMVCIKCECYSSTRHAHAAVTRGAR